MSYTDEQVAVAIRLNKDTQEYTQEDEVRTLVWAASEYLKGKAVIEWYGEMNSHGQKAREYLEKLNQNKE